MAQPFCVPGVVMPNNVWRLMAMARRAAFDPFAETMKSAVVAASNGAHRAARDGARFIRDAGETYRSASDDFADAAHRRIRQGEREADRLGRLIVHEATARPGFAIAMVAASALVGGALLGWALSRRG